MPITLVDARAAAGDPAKRVLYHPALGQTEVGWISTVGRELVFVRFGTDTHSKACYPETLEWVVRIDKYDASIDGWMQTYSGRAVWPLEPHPREIDPADITHALSMLCRYNGHVRRFYSVAEHCVLLSHAVSPGNALWALLHDATEAYMGDMIRPLKRHMPTYAEAEDRLMAAICKRFRLPAGMPAEVKDADTRILLDEREQLMGKPPLPWTEVEDMKPLGVTVAGWEPWKAELAYGRRLAELRVETVAPL